MPEGAFLKPWFPKCLKEFDACQKYMGMGMGMLNIKVDDRGSLKAAANILSEYPKALKKSVRNAAVDCMRGIRAAIPRFLVERYDISKANVRAGMKLSQRVEDGGMRVVLTVTGNRLPVMRFNVLPTSPPAQAGIPVSGRQIVSTIVVKGEAMVGKPNRFVARMPGSGHINVFYRTGDGKKIDQEFRVSVPEMIREHKTIRPQIERQASTTFEKALTRNVLAELKKANGKK
jgi:hypothetical protein